MSTEKLELLQTVASRRSFIKVAGGTAASTALATSALAQTCPTPTPTPTPTATDSVPGEEVEHEATFMQWPAGTALWGASLLNGIQNDIALLARTIAKYEPVYMLAEGTTNGNNARNKIGTTVHPVTIVNIPVDDMWARDSGCVFRKNTVTGKITAVGFNFNGWGNKPKFSQPFAKDALVAERMAAWADVPFVKSTVVGEGGGVVGDGDGTLLANESCWVNSNRNGNKTRATIEAELLKNWGATKMIWCKGVKGKDITDDHCDATVGFARPGVVFVNSNAGDTTSEYAQNAKDWAAALVANKDAKGRTFRAVTLKSPKAPTTDMLSSYINFAVTNGAVINVAMGAVAGGQTSFDTTVKAQMAAEYPGRTVEMLKLSNIYGFGGGGIHCVTQQLPLGN